MNAPFFIPPSAFILGPPSILQKAFQGQLKSL